MTDRYEVLLQRLQQGETVLIDGATGTEIERRGVPMVEKGWNGGGALTHPEIVRQVHEDYIRLGANVVITNTFATSRHVLEDAGMQEHFEFLNRRGVELAREARERAGAPHVLVAGGIAHWSFTDRKPAADQLKPGVEAQTSIMAEAGADLIMLEMMNDIDRTHVMIAAGQKAGLPVWVGFSCKVDENGDVRLWGGPTLEDAVAALKGRDVPLVSIMHTEVSDVNAALDVLQTRWTGPIGVYAHSGDFIPPNWIFDDTISPEDYAAAAAGWKKRGVQVIGGCCGIGAAHMALVSQVAKV